MYERVSARTQNRRGNRAVKSKTGDAIEDIGKKRTGIWNEETLKVPEAALSVQGDLELKGDSDVEIPCHPSKRPVPVALAAQKKKPA